MINSYPLKKYFKSTFSFKQTAGNSISKAVKLFGATALLFASTATVNAQVSSTTNFNNTIDGWSSVAMQSGSFVLTTVSSCEGKSVRANVYYGGSTYLVSPSLGTSNGGTVTMAFDYKVLNYEALVPTPSADFGISAEYSNNANGPWINFYNLSAADHIVSGNCANKQATFTPANGNLYVRLKGTASSGKDLFFYFDNIVFTQGVGATCSQPVNVNIGASTISSTSFTASWTAPSSVPALGYEYEVRSSGPAGSGAGGLVASGSLASTVSTYTINTLTAATGYTFYIRGKCSATDFSLWSTSNSIATLCNASSIPYSIPFSDAIVPALPACIVQENANNDSQMWKTASSVIDMTGIVMKYTYNQFQDANDWFYTAPLNLTAGTTYNLTFQYRISGYEEKLKVAIGSAPSAAVMTTTLFDVTIPDSMNSVVTENISFTVPTSGVYNIGFQAHSDLYQNELFVGAVAVTSNAAPVCEVPTGVTASAITANSAVISWTASTGANNGYAYEVRTSGAAGSGATGLTIAGTTAAGVTTATIADLVANTDYSVYVSAVCSGTSSSEWTATTDFTTLCIVPTINAEHVQTITVDALEDATLTDLMPVGANISWFANMADALVNQNALPLTTQLVSGTTYYAVLDENGCMSLPFDVTVTVALGVSNQIMTGLSYYPNPVQNQLTINYTQDITSVSVFNLVGQKVMSITPNTSNVTVDMSTLARGTYMIQVNAATASKVIKLIKQ